MGAIVPRGVATILQVVPELDTGGAELSTLEVADAVARVGGRPLVATAGGRMADAVGRVGGTVVTLPMASKNPLTIRQNAARLARLIADEHIDLVHARSRAPAWSALWAARRAGVPFVTTYHGAYNERGPIKRFYNSVMARGDLVIANSRYTADLVRARYGTPEARLRVINRGVDLERFEPSRVGAAAVRKLRDHWRVPDGAPIILHPARLTRWKGQAVVLEAAAALAASDNDVSRSAVFVFAGSNQGRSDYSAELTATAERLGISERVRFVGHVDDMPAAFLAADIALVASIEPEAFGRTAAEAQAMGTPVIATAIGAPQETVLAAPAVGEQEATGALVPPGDGRALANAISRILSMPEDVGAAMAARARHRVHTYYSMRQLQVATLGVYDTLLGTDMADRFTSSASD